jgi:hypothetical protein
LICLDSPTQWMSCCAHLCRNMRSAATPIVLSWIPAARSQLSLCPPARPLIDVRSEAPCLLEEMTPQWEKELGVRTKRLALTDDHEMPVGMRFWLSSWPVFGCRHSFRPLLCRPTVDQYPADLCPAAQPPSLFTTGQQSRALPRLCEKLVVLLVF